jgi:predicted Zn-dependent protease
MAFFNPAEDPVILAYNQETRGDSDSAIALFSHGQFEASLEKTSELLLEDPGNQLALLFHLLAAMELNVEAGVLARVEAVELDTRHALGQSLTWYQALAMVKTGLTEEAAALLEGLLSQPGPYESDAHKLQKMLKK